NAVINQFSPAGLRQDVGALWENFLMTERLKILSYRRINFNRYFWRTHAQQEIDYIEERNGKMTAHEFKWNPKSRKKFSRTFMEAYPGTDTKLITPDNMEEWLLGN